MIGQPSTTITTPVQERAKIAVPPDGCEHCLIPVDPHTATVEDGSVRALYTCWPCGYDWWTSWRLEVLP